jgi:hypothetical protein
MATDSLVEGLKQLKSAARRGMLQELGQLESSGSPVRVRVDALVQAADFAIAGLRSCASAVRRPGSSPDSVVAVLRQRIAAHDKGRIVRLGYRSYVEWFVLSLLVEAMSLRSDAPVVCSRLKARHPQ